MFEYVLVVLVAHITVLGLGRRISEKMLFVIGIAMATWTAIVPIFLFPQFESVFKGFGADLPLLTELAIRYYWVLLIFPFAVIATWFYWPEPQKRGVTSYRVAYVGSFLVIAISIVAMYWPIFKLGY